MDYMPFFFDLKGRTCLMVGAGSIAVRKARLLQKAGACLKVVAPEAEKEMLELIEKSEGTYFNRAFEADDINDVVLIIAATNDEVVNQQVSELAQARCLPVNVVDSPKFCTIITPSIVDRSPVMIAVSSGGEAPVLTRLLRAKLEAIFPSAYGQLGQMAKSFRQKVKDSIPSERNRMRFWEKIFTGPVSELVLSGQTEEGEKIFLEQLSEGEESDAGGEVYLVGAGPGDPDLLTFKALRLMQQADVVLHDRLVSEPVLNLVRRDADRIYVGKRRADHAMPQQNINQLLVDLAKEGKRVLRLKGGDPFIFGRGGEELELLAENQIPFQVVPGITAASGCSVYSGIPLTHRDYAQSVRFVTGNTKAGKLILPWQSLLDDSQTLVFYMGLKTLKGICAGLILHGRDPETPAALIEKGTTPDQRIVISTLESLPEKVEEMDIHAPTLLIIGGVVTLHSQLSWYIPTKTKDA